MTTPATPLPLLLAALVLLLGAAPAPGRADDPAPLEPVGSPPPPPLEPARPDLRMVPGLWTQAGVTGGLLLLVGGAQLYSERQVVPASCRWCEPPQVDRWARQQLLWKDPQSAALYGNLLIVAVPAGVAIALGAMAHAQGAGFREGAEDILVISEAATITLVLMQVAKFTTARARPDAWAGSGSTAANSRMSFYAGHAAVAFAVAAAGTQVARMRGRPGWGWLSAASFAGAAACGYFRIASDNHWLTDVVAGAAIGTAVGFTLPGLVLSPAGERSGGVTVVPAPGGLALIF
jgi:hypothetical protein